MTEGEFNLATRPYLMKKPVITGNMKAHGLRMKVQAMIEQLGAADLPDIDNGGIRRALDAELAQLIQAAKSVRKQIG